MSKYQEMCEAVIEAERQRAEYREHCWQYMATLYNEFLEYTETPANLVTLLKWNGSDDENSCFSPPEKNMVYALPGATVLGEDGFWRLGLRIFLKPIATVWFAFFVAEQEGRPLVKVGDKTYKIDWESPNARNKLYDDIVNRIKDAFTGQKKQGNKGIGFVVEQARN